MKQSWAASLFETIGSTASGFLLSLGLQYGVCWWFDLPLRLHDNLAIIGLFTGASLLRGIAWRRWMEKLHVRLPLTAFMRAVIAEYYRQIEVEGFDKAHDDRHAPGELGASGAAYLLASYEPPNPQPPSCWPWDLSWWKPKDVRRNLVRGCALGVAEGEKFERMRKRKVSTRAQWPAGAP